MKIYRSSHKSNSLAGLLALLLLGLLSNQSTANSVSNYPLDIISPQPNLDTKNRFYKAYPELEYNVRLGVTGGSYPFSYELTSAPAGMAIDNRGEITWANPTESPTQYNVTAKVTDAHAVTRDVSWPITVTKNGFRFLDGINGKSTAQGGTGTFANPWKSMKDMYEGDDAASRFRNSYSGEFLYWRTGTYTMDAYRESNLSMSMIGDRKPIVWLAYPGEKPVLDMADAHLSLTGGTNAYFDGLEFDVNGNNGIGRQGIQIGSSASNVTIRRNKLHGLTNGFNGGNNSLIFISRNKAGNNYTIQDNEFYDVGTGYGILGYNAKNVLVEDNTLYNIGSHPISPKQGTQKWFIRSNLMYDNDLNSINVQYTGTEIPTGDIEISYNLVLDGGGKVRINSGFTPNGSSVNIFRNTFLDEVNVNKVTSTNGAFSFYDNVIVNETSYLDKIQRVSIDDPSNLIVTDNLVGSASDNIVDANGNLTANFIQYLGQRGYQLAEQSVPEPTSAVLLLLGLALMRRRARTSLEK